MEALTGSMRYSVLAITVFFVLSLFFMLLLYRKIRIETRSQKDVATTA